MLTVDMNDDMNIQKKQHNFGFWGLLETKDVSFSLANLSSQQPRKPHPNTVQLDTGSPEIGAQLEHDVTRKRNHDGCCMKRNQPAEPAGQPVCLPGAPRFRENPPRNENKGFNDLIPNLNRENSHGVSPKPLISMKATYIFTGRLGKETLPEKMSRHLHPIQSTEVETQQLE